MPPTSNNQQRVFAAIQNSPTPPTVPELARRLGIAQVTVRRHVSDLKAARRIRVYGGPPGVAERALTGKAHYRYEAVAF